MAGNQKLVCVVKANGVKGDRKLTDVCYANCIDL